jgi:hypothetical protein
MTIEAKWDRPISPEVISRYRELERAGGFRRAVKERIPTFPRYDELVLECGHRSEISAKLADSAPAGFRYSCDPCESDWLKRAQDAFDAGQELPDPTNFR